MTSPDSIVEALPSKEDRKLLTWLRDATLCREWFADRQNGLTASYMINDVYERMKKLLQTPSPMKALEQFVYETTCLSPMEDDGSHKCRISRKCLEKGREALRLMGAVLPPPPKGEE